MVVKCKVNSKVKLTAKRLVLISAPSILVCLFVSLTSAALSLPARSMKENLKNKLVRMGQNTIKNLKNKLVRIGRNIIENLKNRLVRIGQIIIEKLKNKLVRIRRNIIENLTNKLVRIGQNIIENMKNRLVRIGQNINYIIVTMSFLNQQVEPWNVGFLGKEIDQT